MKLSEIFEDVDKELVEKILNEDGNSQQDVMDAVSPLQKGIMNKILSGRFDPIANHSDAVQQALDNLVTLQLLDQTYALTGTGYRTIQQFNNGKESDKQLAIQRATSNDEMNDQEDDLEVEMDDFEDEDMDNNW